LFRELHDPTYVMLCCGKHGLTRSMAVKRVLEHRGRTAICFGQFEKYRCRVNTGIWHVGHRGKKRAELEVHASNGWYWDAQQVKSTDRFTSRLRSTDGSNV